MRAAALARGTPVAARPGETQAVALKYATPAGMVAQIAERALAWPSSGRASVGALSATATVTGPVPRERTPVAAWGGAAP